MIEKAVHTRVGLSPVCPDFPIGVYRTYAFAYIVARAAVLRGSDTSTCVVRCDDTNGEKTRSEHLQPLLSILLSLGMNFDATPNDPETSRKRYFSLPHIPTSEFSGIEGSYSLVQSERSGLYRKYAERIVAGGMASIDTDGAIYFSLSAYCEKYGRQLMIQHPTKGLVTIDIQKALMVSRNGDGVRERFPLIGSDGRPLFHLASVIDEYLLGITDVVRGTDLQPAQYYQEMIRVCLNLPTVNYYYLPWLIHKTADEKPTYLNLLKAGIPTEAIVSYIISSVYGDPDQIYLSFDEVASQFSFSQLHQKETAVDWKRISSIAKKIQRHSKFSASHTRRALHQYWTAHGKSDLITCLDDNLGIDWILQQSSVPIPELARQIEFLLKPAVENQDAPQQKDFFRIAQELMDCVYSGMSLTEAVKQTLGKEPKTPADLVYSVARWLCAGQENRLRIDQIEGFLQRKNIKCSLVFPRMRGVFQSFGVGV